ncbi:hypothetical protein BJ912DRAFT_1071440 [Pholiota molesta]|nr:hypothetical protein BJ912DRAFT_1071440 [Pholiota molesta]
MSTAPRLVMEHVKDWKSCQNKWAALRKTFKVIAALMNNSGWHWDDETGASITPESASVWDAYINLNPLARPYCNKGWPHRVKIADIMPNTTTGANVFHPASISQTPSVDSQPDTFSPIDRPGSPAWDIEEPLPSDNDEVTPVALSSRKRAREPATPSHPSAKRNRRSHGAEALYNMSTSLAGFGEMLSSALAPPSNVLPPTPIRCTNAVVFAQENEMTWLDPSDMITFIDLLRRDKSAADVYMALKDNGLRRRWVEVQLQNA